MSRAIFYVLGAVGVLSLGASVGFVSWCHEQTQYLIWFDSWPFFFKLMNGAPLSEYLFHNVHVFAGPNLALYLDTVLASGSWRFLHLATHLMNVGSALCVYYLLKSTLPGNTSRVMTVGLAALVMSMWISPANYIVFVYHIVGVIASGSLLFALLATSLHCELAKGKYDGAKRLVLIAALAWVVFLGFACLEIYTVVIGVLVVAALASRDRLQGTVLSVLLATLIASYVVFRYEAIRSVSLDMSVERDLWIVARNTLHVLSGHLEHLATGLGLTRSAAQNLALAFLLWEVGTMAALGVRRLVRRERFDHLWRAALVLSSFALASCISAAWLRYGDRLLPAPVPRYLPYGIMFSMAVMLVCISELGRSGNAVRAWLTAPLLVATATTGVAALAVGSVEMPAAVRGKLEMPLYAQQPGTERQLGPGPEKGAAAYRRRLHGFLLDRNLAVFSSPGYHLLGRRLSDRDRSSAGCDMISRRVIVRNGHRIFTASVRDPESDGVFAIVDGDLVVTSFGFSVQPTWRNNGVRTQLLLPVNLDAGLNRLVFVEDNDGTLGKHRLCGTL